MQYKTSILLIGLAALSSSAVLAQEFDNNDVPQQCRSVCQAMVDAARTCDNNFDGDRQEVDCICNTEGASTQLPECAACVRQFDTDIDEDDRDEQNDVDEVMSSCGFTSTTFNAAAAGSSSSSSSGGTMTSSSSGSLITSTYTTTSTDIDNDPDDQDETETLTRTTIFPADATPTDAAGSATQSAGSVTSSAGGSAEAATSNANAGADSATSGAGASATGGDDASGAAATALPMLGAGAGALVAVFGLL